MAVVTDVAALDRCRADGTLAMVLHLEGAEAIDPGLSALDAWHAAGVRSIGLVWSRPSAFGHGVPFRFPASPDTGPGLTDAGRALVLPLRRAGHRRRPQPPERRRASPTSSRLAAAPIVVSHTACHALCASTRNLTDDQLREVARSDGLVGIVFCPAFLRADGADDADTPLATLVAHVRHAAELVGVDRVGLGSDFDGAPMPAELSRRRRPPPPARRSARGRLRRRRGGGHRVGQLAARARRGLGRLARGRRAVPRAPGAVERLPVDRRGQLRAAAASTAAAASVVAAPVVARAAHEPRRHARGLDAGDDEQRAGEVAAAGHDRGAAGVAGGREDEQQARGQHDGWPGRARRGTRATWRRRRWRRAPPSAGRAAQTLLGASLPAVGRNASPRVARDACAEAQSALSSSVISFTEALASPKSIAVFAS